MGRNPKIFKGILQQAILRNNMSPTIIRKYSLKDIDISIVTQSCFLRDFLTINSPISRSMLVAKKKKGERYSSSALQVSLMQLPSCHNKQGRVQTRGTLSVNHQSFKFLSNKLLSALNQTQSVTLSLTSLNQALVSQIILRISLLNYFCNADNSTAYPMNSLNLWSHIRTRDEVDSIAPATRTVKFRTFDQNFKHFFRRIFRRTDSSY